MKRIVITLAAGLTLTAIAGCGREAEREVEAETEAVGERAEPVVGEREVGERERVAAEREVEREGEIERE